MKRGIVLAPIANIENGYLKIAPVQIDATLLRHALLYFDRIAFAQGSMFGYSSQDIEYLVDRGHAETVRVPLRSFSGKAWQMYARDQWDAFSILNQRDNNTWTLGQHARNLIFPDKPRTLSTVAEITINAALPSPPELTCLDEIIDFRTRHDSKLRELRNAIDNLHETAIQSPEPGRAIARSAEQVADVINRLRIAAHESWLQRIPRSTSFHFRIADSVRAFGEGAIVGNVLGNKLGIPHLDMIGGIVNVARKSVTIDFKNLLLPDIVRVTDQPFAYIVEAEKQLPGTLPVKTPD